MKRQSGLFDQITRFENLLLAARKAAQGKRDRATVARFEFHLEQELLILQETLQEGSYQPGAFFTFEIHDPKRRRICAAPFRDRVVHHAVCNVLEPVFEKRLIFDTYACRPGKGTHAAIERVQRFARRHGYFLKCDIRKFFQSIDHEILKSLLARIFKDRALFDLLERVIDHAPPDAEPNKGLPIGNLTSQHFANQYLGELDHYLKDRLRIKGYLRYMDDLLLFAHDKPVLHLWLADLRRFLRENLRLELKGKATQLAPVTQGISFLGFRIYPGVIRLNWRNLHRFRRQVRGLDKAYRAGWLSVEDLSNSVAGLFAHVAHADTMRLRRQAVNDSLDLG